MPVQPKDPEKRQRSHAGKRKTTDLAALPSRYSLPEAPPDLLPSVREEWDAFWGSELGRMARAETETAELRRLFFYRNQWERMASVLADPDTDVFVAGSTGQMKTHPAFDRMQKLEAAMLAIEDRFGLNPRQRMALGATVVDTAKTLAEVNAKAREQSNPEPRPAPVALSTNEE